MRELLECQQEWLAKNRADGGAYSLLVALTRETLKRVDSPDPAQREFDAEALAAAADGPEGFDLAKRWIDRAKLDLFVKARLATIEQHFRAAGHLQALRVIRRSPGGKHRAVWYLEAYQLERDLEGSTLLGQPEPGGAPESRELQYEFAPPGKLKPAWYLRPLIGSGSLLTRSWRGLLWAATFLFTLTYLLFNLVVGLSYTYVQRPLHTADLASMLALAAIGWVVWRVSIRPFVWLIDDRIINVSESWVAWNEQAAQLELVKNSSSRRMLQLVRYSAVCPICAGTIELRYSQGPNRRRLLGCCNEAPHEHVFSFDRVARRGSRLSTGDVLI